MAPGFMCEPLVFERDSAKNAPDVVEVAPGLLPARPVSFIFRSGTVKSIVAGTGTSYLASTILLCLSWTFFHLTDVQRRKTK
jgi:hypothetical protein